MYMPTSVHRFHEGRVLVGYSTCTGCSGYFLVLLVFMQINLAFQAVVEVNEEGSEAAAVTGVVMVQFCASMEVIKPFIADRPFLFFIIDKRADIVLFMGHVFSPPHSPSSKDEL
ncbi:hypothetical protein BaRGS_00031643 [Batillaria attramentaria]|uniref:Serpin domain-containing protein n=1 Tax=Batillaria attramentaria TaxID=370345 RepID=A0ABD0JR34_9CAEN